MVMFFIVSFCGLLAIQFLMKQNIVNVNYAILLGYLLGVLATNYYK